MRLLDGISSMDMSLSKLWDGEGQGSLACCSPWSTKSRTQLSDRTTANGMTSHTMGICCSDKEGRGRNFFQWIICEHICTSSVAWAAKVCITFVISNA